MAWRVCFSGGRYCVRNFFVDKILTTSRRRRERRQRALARHQWWLVKQNHLKPSKQTLQAWFTTLAAHHSRDPRLLKSIKAAMATASNAELAPWKCSCMRLNKKTAEFCGQCGKHWTKVPSLQPTKQWNAWSQWEGWENHSKAQQQESSARQRSASRRKKPKGGKGGSKDGSKKGKEQDNGQPFSLPSPFVTYQPPTSSTPWVGETTPTEVSPFQVSQQSNAAQSSTNAELVAALTKAYASKEQMPSEVRELVDRAAQQNSKSITKELHSAIVHFGTSEESSCRDCRISKATSSSLDPTPPRCNCHVEPSTPAIHGAPSDAFRTRRTCYPRNTSGDKGDSGIEQQGSRCIGKSPSTYCTRALGQQHGGSQEGPGERGAQDATTQGIVGVRKSYRGRCEGKGVKGRHHHRRFRQRARVAYTKTTQIHRSHWYLVKDGRIVSCLKVNGRCKGHRKVCFDVVEAYDQGHHAAGHVLAFIPLPAFETTAMHHPVAWADVCYGSQKTPQVDRADRAAVPTLQSRPNADLVQDFDDNLPLTSSSEDESGAPYRHIPPPDWRNSAELGRAHGDRALFSRADGHLVVKLTTWLVDHGRHNQYQDSRPLTIRPQIFSLLNQKLRKLWRDQVGRRDVITYVLVTPTPAVLADEDRTLHVIVEKNKPPRTEWKAILFTLRAIEGGVPQEADRRAVLVHQVITREGLGESLGIGCNPVHLMVPSGRRQGWLQAREERIVTSGLHIPIWWDLRRRIETPREEETSLFQLTMATDHSWKSRLDPEPDSPIDTIDRRHDNQPLHDPAPPTDDTHPGGGVEHIDECLTMYATDTEEETQIHTYGLLGWHIGTRSGSFRRGDQQGLRNEVRRLWSEIEGSWNILNVEMLSNPPSELHVIVEFFEGRLERHNEMPSLRRTFSHQDSSPVIEATYLPSESTRNGILYHGGFDNKCTPWKQHKCSVRVDNAILVSEDRAWLHTGSLIDIWIYGIEEDEVTQLMQRSLDTTTPESSDEDQIWSTLHMPEETFPVTLRAGGTMTILEAINQEWQSAGKTCGYTAMHEVHEPPDDLAAVSSRTVILEHPLDLVSRLAYRRASTCRHWAHQPQHRNGSLYIETGLLATACNVLQHRAIPAGVRALRKGGGHSVHITAQRPGLG